MKTLKAATLCVALMIGITFSATAQGMNDSDMNSDQTIVDIASQTSNLSTLVKALKAADLVDTLNGDGPFTVFAPTNDAFNALPDGTLKSLMKPGNKSKLSKILTYHVVPGKIMASDLKDGQMVKTVQGNKVKISLSNGGAMVDNANITKTDIEASNGVVHIIDAVIMPSDNNSDNQDDSGY